MTPPPAVSVIIPTHNRGDLVLRALGSVYAQTLAPPEVIVVDDGSTDGTEDRVCSAFPAVRYVRQENRGVSAARNAGIRRARGRWIAFLDSDDAWTPSKLARQAEALARHDGYLISHTDEIWIRHGRRVNPKKRHAKSGGHIFTACLPLCVISPSAVMIERTLFDRVGMFDETLPACEDYDMWLRICARYPVLFVEEPLVIKYGGHGDQLSRRHWGMDRFRVRALEKLLQGGGLSPHHKAEVLRVLVAKLGIYLQGAQRRDKVEEVRRMGEKLALYTAMADGTRSAVRPGGSGVD